MLVVFAKSEFDPWDRKSLQVFGLLIIALGLKVFSNGFPKAKRR